MSGYVTATKSQVFGDVTEDVDHLQCFTKSDSIFKEQFFLFLREFHHVCERHFCPKDPHTTSDSEGVIIQFFFGLERGYVSTFSGDSKSLQIQNLSAHNDIEAFKHSHLIILLIHR